MFLCMYVGWFDIIANVMRVATWAVGSSSSKPRAQELTCSINRFPYFSIRELSKRSDTLIPAARTRRAPKLVFYIQSIQSLMLFVRDITGMLPMFTDAPNHIGFANFCLRTLFHFTVSSGRENVILDIVLVYVLNISLFYICIIQSCKILLNFRKSFRFRSWVRSVFFAKSAGYKLTAPDISARVEQCANRNG